METGDIEVLAVLAVEGEGVDVPSFIGVSDAKRVVLIETSSLKLKWSPFPNVTSESSVIGDSRSPKSISQD